jgi:hypothetical protein
LVSITSAQRSVAGDPRAVLADLHCREDTEVGEPAGQRGVVARVVLEQGANLVLVGEDDIDAVAELTEEPVARGVDHLERR